MLNSTKCICGEELQGKQFEKYLPFPLDDKFYGGRVTMTGNIKCKCGRKVKGYFQRMSQNLELIDLELIEEPLTLGEGTNYMPKTYEEMTYKELQTIAKGRKIEKLNIKREELIELLKQEN